MPIHFALLRGINVGGKNSLAMRDLVALFEEAGCSEVSTYIQSGNVIFQASAKAAASACLKVRKRLETEFDLDVPIILRSAARLSAAVERNPFLPKADPQSLHLGFLADKPKPSLVAALDPKRSPGDSFQVLGSEVYLHCPSGLGKSKLTSDFFDRGLGTTVTVRNWRTVAALLERSQSPS